MITSEIPARPEWMPKEQYEASVVKAVLLTGTQRLQESVKSFDLEEIEESLAYMLEVVREPSKYLQFD